MPVQVCKRVSVLEQVCKRVFELEQVCKRVSVQEQGYMFALVDLDTGALAGAGAHKSALEVVVYKLAWLPELACKLALLVEVAGRLAF